MKALGSSDEENEVDSDVDASDALRGGKRKKKKKGVVSRSRRPPSNLPLKSVIKIFVTRVSAKYDSAWRRKNELRTSGSGFLMNTKSHGPVIISNSHVVFEHTTVRVRKPGCPTKFPAKVLCIGREVDLAVISVESKEFWDGLPMLEVEDRLPMLDEDVTAVGYPTGGEGISVTRGVVSRVCMQQYVNGGGNLLTVQIDAAINPGNSGGPVFDNNGRIVGVARAVIMLSQNIGYIISIPVLRLFLLHFERYGYFMGISSIGCKVQKMESPALKQRLKVPEEYKGGVRVRQVPSTGTYSEVWKPDDVIIAVDSIEVANDCTVPLGDDRPDERVHFFHLISRVPIGDKISLKVIRDGELKELQLEMKRYPHKVPILHMVDCVPRYYIVGGLIFVPITLPWIFESFRKRKCTPIISQALTEFEEDKEFEYVCLSKVLSTECNFGYQKIRREIVSEFHGVKIKNLAHLVDMVEACEDTWLEFKLLDDRLLVLDRMAAQEADDQILKEHSIADKKMNIEYTLPLMQRNLGKAGAAAGSSPMAAPAKAAETAASGVGPDAEASDVMADS